MTISEIVILYMVCTYIAGAIISANSPHDDDFSTLYNVFEWLGSPVLVPYWIYLKLTKKL